MVFDRIVGFNPIVSAQSMVRTHIEKVPFPPRPQGLAEESGPLHIMADEVEGFTRVYDLERRPITPEEMDMATELMENEKLRMSLLLFHMAIVDYSAQYFERNPEHLQHSMMSFNQFFVVEGKGDAMELLPNPRLIATLSNNVAPAIAAVMLREGASADELTSDYISKGISEVRRQRLFQSHIGKFNNLDPQTGAVEFEAFFNHICPATRVLTESLTTWLPKIFDRCSRE